MFSTLTKAWTALHKMISPCLNFVLIMCYVLTIAIWRVKIFINFSSMKSEWEVLEVDGLWLAARVQNLANSIVQLSLSEEAETKENRSIHDECGTQRSNFSSVSIKVDPSSTSRISTPTKQEHGTFEPKMLSAAVEPSKQAAFKCKELATRNSIEANKSIWKTRV